MTKPDLLPDENSSQMPDEIYAGMLSSGSTYYTSHKIEVAQYDCKHAKGMAQTKYIRADLVSVRETDEPVAWQMFNPRNETWVAVDDKAKADLVEKAGYKVRPLYTKPAQPNQDYKILGANNATD